MTLFRLGRSAAGLLGSVPDRATIVAFASDYLDALHAAKLAFAEVARGNLRKARGAFIVPCPEDLIDFDAEFGVEEQLPRTFRIRVNPRGSGRSYLQWHGVFIGDPLTDNIADPDGYRFHDVFHFAYSAILHWSPVMRALIKHKRKSKPDYDEAQDSGRAIVVEEGLTAWIFTRAKELNFFEGQDRVSLGMLKTIGEFVTGYEVSQCPLKLWERAILEGYGVFRQIRAAVKLPLLRKDFIIDERQILEAIEWGADAILLIVAILSDEQLAKFHSLAVEAGLVVLVEVHDEEELERALKISPALLGVNNRNLKTFKVDLATTENLASKIIKSGSLLVAESGIHTRADVERVQKCGAGAILVGESLVKQGDIGAKVRELIG